MPIFEYTCDQCDVRFETLVLSAAGPAREQIRCRHCGSANVTKNLSTFSAHSASSPRKGAGPAPSSGGGGGCGRPGGCGCH